jgi:chaperonin cofactor prefoldin
MSAPNPLQQQMFELSGLLSETVNTLKITEANIVALDAERRRLQLTISEVGQQDDNTVLYKPVGRAYLIKDKDELLLDLNNHIRRNEQEIEESQKKRELLIKKRDEITVNLQELVIEARN